MGLNANTWFSTGTLVQSELFISDGIEILKGILVEEMIGGKLC
jgi:hypothetical protein